jgi:hypothetical protein
MSVRRTWATRYVPDREALPRGGECRVYRSASRRPPPEQEWLNWVNPQGSLRVMRTTACGASASLPRGPARSLLRTNGDAPGRFLSRQHNARERTCLPPGVGALGCSPRNEVEDVPVLVLPELGFARMVLFSEFEDGPAAQQALDIAAAVKIHPALRYVPAVVGAE